MNTQLIISDDARAVISHIKQVQYQVLLHQTTYVFIKMHVTKIPTQDIRKNDIIYSAQFEISPDRIVWESCTPTLPTHLFIFSLDSFWRLTIFARLTPVVCGKMSQGVKQGEILVLKNTRV